VGPAKAATLLAALELGRRLAQRRLHTGDAIRGPQDVYRHFHARLRDAPHEQFHLLLLDGRHRLLREVMASRGTLTASLVHPREVFRPALREGAAALVVVHNHPSGDPAPSAEDGEVTRRLVQAGALLGVPLLDHVVVAERGWVSLREQGELETLPWGEAPARG
jgi:DNA repair protein RadC